MIQIDRFNNVRTGQPLCGFFLRNRTGKVLATGADGRFVQMRHSRYANDRDLVAAIGRLTGLQPRP